MSEAGSGRRLLTVLDGPHAGQKFYLPDGETILGRSADADIVLDDDSISRRHAAVTVSPNGRVRLDDLGSRNGTWLNDQRVAASQELLDGDEVGLGEVRLSFHAPPSPVRPPPPRSRKLWRGALLAGAAEVVVLLGNVAANALAGWTGTVGWLAAPVVGVLVAMVNDVLKKSEPEEQPERQPGRGQPSRARGPEAASGRPRGAPSLVLVLAVLAVVGLALAFGVRYVSGLVTGNEPGVERLEAQQGIERSGVALTVLSVLETDHFTQVRASVRNSLEFTVTLPVYKNAVLTPDGGESLEADPFRSSWTDSIPPGAERQGRITFPGHLPGSRTAATLSFSTVFGQGFGGPASLTTPPFVLKDLASARATAGAAHDGEHAPLGRAPGVVRGAAWAARAYRIR